MRHKDLFINKWQKRRGWLPVILITAAFVLGGCGKAQAVETGATGAKLSEQTTETTLAKSSETITDTADPSSVLLPENMTMDDLRNILVVNGETLTLPTSLNKLMEMDEDFSYEAQYVDEKSPLYNGKQKGFVFDIFYKDDWLVTASLPTDKKDVSAILDADVYHMSFNKMDCEETGMQAGLSCNLGFGSSLEEIEKIFGEPNVFTIGKTNKDYEFYDKDYKCKLSFKISSKNDNLVSFFSISIFPKTSKREFETTYEITEWSPDDFRTVQCCGIDITVPCKLSDIDSRFETKITKGEVTESTFVELYYDGEYVGALSYGKGNDDMETDYLPLMMLAKFSVNGLSDKSAKKDVQNTLGIGNVIDSDIVDFYYGSDTAVSFQYFSSGTEICVCAYEETDITGAQLIDDIQTTVEPDKTETSGREFETTYEITEWSPDDFRTVQCCGADITIPCKLSDISKEFKTQITAGEVSGAKFVELYYNDEYVGSLSSTSGAELLTVAILDKFSVNGLSESSTKEDVQSVLGSGNVIDSEVLDSYYVNNSVVSFTYSGENKTEICICFYEEITAEKSKANANSDKYTYLKNKLNSLDVMLEEDKINNYITYGIIDLDNDNDDEFFAVFSNGDQGYNEIKFYDIDNNYNIEFLFSTFGFSRDGKTYFMFDDDLEQLLIFSEYKHSYFLMNEKIDAADKNGNISELFESIWQADTPDDELSQTNAYINSNEVSLDEYNEKYDNFMSEPHRDILYVYDEKLFCGSDLIDETDAIEKYILNKGEK